MNITCAVFTQYEPQLGSSSSLMPRFEQMKDFDGTTIEMDSMAHMRRLLERKPGRNTDQD